MLEPEGRVVLLDQLRPPLGYRLEAAVGTTFTLQLTAALVPPLAFASHELRTRPDPIAALEAVRSCTDRVDVFCQAGQIAIPGQASDLMAFLEPMVHPVGRPKRGFLFHPKIWFLRYTAPDLPDAYRFLCSTRNLVDSQAWDAVVTLDGVLSERRIRERGPLSALLRHLPEWAVTPLDEARRDRVLNLAELASQVVWTPPPLVSEVKFYAFGVPRLSAKPDFSGYRHLIVSPFCNEGGLVQVTGGNTRDVALVSRAEELDALVPQLVDGLRRPGDEAVFVLDPLAGLADPEEGSESTPSTLDRSELSGLHAKMTIAERNNREAHVFLGSANATTAAYGGNVEFLVELVGRSKDLGVDTLLARGSAATGFRDILQPYRRADQRLPADDDDRRRLENLLRTIAAVPCRIEVEPAHDGHRLHLVSDDPLGVQPDHALVLGLLTRPGLGRPADGRAPLDLWFDGIALADVTPFVTVRVSDQAGLTLGTVIQAPLVNDPEGRLDEVLARQVDTREKFLRFLALLLGLGDPAAPWARAIEGGAESSSWGGPFRSGTGVFEVVLAALADRPETLLDLDRLVQRLRATDAGSSILPEGFGPFWDAVTAALSAVDGES